MEVEVVTSRGAKTLATLKNVTSSSSIRDLKMELSKAKPTLKVERMELRAEAKGKALKDKDTLQSVGVKSGGKLFFKDLGPQISWKTVFLVEYAGPIFIYLWIYQRPWILYGEGAAQQPRQRVVNIAAVMWTIHYVKRLLETLFVHRFSHATMPLRNLFKNCSYYWLFAGYVAYHVNHPLYTSPPFKRIEDFFLVSMIVCEVGNLSIHMLLRDLRPPGTKQRRVPYPNSNPFTFLFNFVSCPNYTYEVLSWVTFSIMTFCLPGIMFALAGLFQMTIWALAKHRTYMREFNTYPRDRKAIVPFIL